MRLTIFSTNKNRITAKNIITNTSGEVDMDKTKYNEMYKLEAASEISADIKEGFSEQDPEAKATLVGGRMIKKMIERKISEE